MAAAEEAVRIQREEEAKAMYALELQRKKDQLDAQVAAQRTTLEQAIARVRTSLTETVSA